MAAYSSRMVESVHASDSNACSVSSRCQVWQPGRSCLSCLSAGDSVAVNFSC